MKEKIKCQFQSQKEEMRIEVKKIYEQIVDKTSKRPIEEIVRVMTVEESKLMNDYCVKVRNKIEMISKKLLIENGISENSAEILWTKVRLATGTPKVELCKEIPVDAGKEEEKYIKPKQKTHYGEIITVSGVVIEVIGWFFIPGLQTVAAITKTLGIVLVATGAYTMYKENSATNPRITLNDTAKAARARKVAETISEEQNKLNTGIISEWMDYVADALYHEYKKKTEASI